MGDSESYRIDVENSFMFFLLVLQNLGLSERVKSLMYRSDTILVGFVYRNWQYVPKLKGVLVL